jgi:hypothetical protein
MTEMKRLCITRVLRRIAALASGALLLQTSGCVIEDSTLTEMLNAVLEAYLSSATTTY